MNARDLYPLPSGATQNVLFYDRAARASELNEEAYNCLDSVKELACALTSCLPSQETGYATLVAMDALSILTADARELYKAMYEARRRESTKQAERYGEMMICGVMAGKHAYCSHPKKHANDKRGAA
ncbi:MAG: hypothetical protein LBQ20_03735 [Rhodanobacter sp.]|jgi:hypothetical protein|nr:hypothetical protein [Rhodanobacter sp.]